MKNTYYTFMFSCDASSLNITISKDNTPCETSLGIFSTKSLREGFRRLGVRGIKQTSLRTRCIKHFISNDYAYECFIKQ